MNTDRTFTITGREFRALMANAAKNDVRYYLAGFFVDTANNTLVSTDGHAMLLVPFTPPADCEPRIYSFDAVKIPKSAEIVTIDMDAHTLSAVSKSGKVVTTAVLAVIDGKYPDWQSVTPSDDEIDSGPAAFGFNPELVARSTRELGEVVKLQFTGSENCPFLITWNETDARAIVMPARR